MRTSPHLRQTRRQSWSRPSVSVFPMIWQRDLYVFLIDARHDPGDAISGGSKMAIEKRERPGHGFLCCLCVVAGASVVIECMTRVIPTDLHLRMGSLHLLDISLRDMAVLPPEVKQNRRARALLCKPGDVATVVADGGGG